jgi:DNA-binding transcriptional regulator WhiA
MNIGPDLAELIGVIIGDGNILYKYRNKWNRLSISGDVEQDVDYFKKIGNIIFELAGKKPKIRKRVMKKGKCLELYFDNKKFVEYLVDDLELDYGNKVFTVRIPKKFLDWKYSKHILRGLFEADGSLYFSKSKVRGLPSYPRLEIRTVSEKLAFQVYNLLKNNDFNVQIMKTKYKDFKIYLSGERMLEMWIREIGFSNKNTISKYLLWQKLGHYIPRITASERKKLLKE